MKFSIAVDTVKSEGFIVYIEVLQGYNLKKKYYIYFSEDLFGLRKQCRS